jgi:hypothetical protein
LHFHCAVVAGVFDSAAVRRPRHPAAHRPAARRSGAAGQDAYNRSFHNGVTGVINGRP